MSDLDHMYERIRTRRAEIQRQRLALEQEDGELAITERHIARFLPTTPMPRTEPAAPTTLGQAAAKVVESIAPDPPRKMRKPKGVPTVFRMACEVLRHAAVEGRPWLDAQAITDEIKARWWPEAEVAFIQPQLWRVATKRGALLKDGKRYALPGIEKAPNGSPVGASQADGAAVSAA